MQNSPSVADLRFRLGYTLLPVLRDSAPAKRNLEILIARTTLGESEARRLAFIQYAKWYCEEVDASLQITLHVPANAGVVRAAFDLLGVEYNPIAALDEHAANAVSDIAKKLDCDFVLSADSDGLYPLFTDEIGLVSADVEDALHITEIHLRGFDVTWSFESPSKNSPWTSFYLMGNPSVFHILLREHTESRAAGDAAFESMRGIVYDAIPSLCFSRDRLEFYRVQDRWAQRIGLRQQNFAFEYTAYLNHFYLTFYAAVDQVAGLVVNKLRLAVPENEVGATFKAFRHARKPYAEIDNAFSDKAFWEMYKIPRLMRHRAAHSGPVKPNDVYFGTDDFSDDQLDKAAEEAGFFDDLHVLERRGIADEMRAELVQIARFKAKLKLMGPPRRHGVFLRDGKKGLFYYPGPASDLERFLTFFHRVLKAVKPWNSVV